MWHRSGDWQKNISKALNIPWSTIKTIIKKWKAYSTTKTLLRSGRPSKLDDQSKRRLIREANGNLERATGLYGKEWSLCACDNNILRGHKSGLHGRVARRKPLLKKANLESRLRYAKKTFWRF